MGIRFNGEIVTPKVFAKLFMFDNMKSLHEHAEMIFKKYPEKYSGMTDREIKVVREGMERVIETMERSLGLEKVHAKSKMKKV
jgi:hypothetical protein